MYISRIRLENIRGFRELEIDFSGTQGPRKRTLIIGKNGTCKTTVLRAIALGICDDANALISEPIGSMIYKDSRVGQIRIELDSPKKRRLNSFLVRNRINGQERVSRLSELDWPKTFTCGYGAGRHGFGSDTGREYRVADAVYTLFDYRRTLIDPELTLRRLQDFLGTRRYDAAISGIRRVLGLVPKDEIRLPQGGGVELSGPSFGGTVRLEGWADGYRMTFNWMMDLYGLALRADRITPDGHIRGIVLIDEIEQHLHPSMQAEILPRITEVFPEIQLIATTHSPLVALDAKPDELIVLRREEGEVFREEAVPDFTGYSAEDMLVDERLFDTEIYSPEMREKVGRYRELAAIPKATRGSAETRELRGLALEIRERPVPESRDNEMVRQLKQLIDKHNL
ncbi:MAG TPA: AAA family ATPase [Thermoanaerobaculia bacterium]